MTKKIKKSKPIKENKIKGVDLIGIDSEYTEHDKQRMDKPQDKENPKPPK